MGNRQSSKSGSLKITSHVRSSSSGPWQKSWNICCRENVVLAYGKTLTERVGSVMFFMKMADSMCLEDFVLATILATG